MFFPRYVKNWFFRKLPTLVREREKTILEHAKEPRTRPPLQWWVLDIWEKKDRKLISFPIN